MNCEKCRWYEEPFVQHTINGKIYKGICLLCGCDGSLYEPMDGESKCVECKGGYCEEDCGVEE